MADVICEDEMKSIVMALVFIFSVSVASFAENPKEFDKGVNMALQAIMLLDLELKLKGERKTWGEMADIVRERLSVPKTDNKANSADTKKRAAD